MVRIVLAMLLVACGGLAEAQFVPEKLSPLDEAIATAMQGDVRSADEKARDAERKPRQTLGFFGLEDDMRVVELFPAGGYYTKILAPVLADKGELYVAIGTARGIEPLIRDVPAMAKVKVAPADAKIVPAAGQMGLFDLGDFSLGVRDADLVLTFRNYHNLTPAARASLNRAVFDALKAGGRYGIVDHTRRHNEPDSKENWRRMDPVRVIREVQAAGFLLEDSSDLHYIPDDELRYEVGRKSVAGNTDRFALRFRKP